jgi:hypothetical protein
MNPRQQQAKILRIFRKIHRVTGALLFVFFFIIAFSGILLGWKNNSNGYILPKSQMGTTSSLEQWKPLYTLYNNACFILHDSISPNLSIELDRIDIRKENGIAKVVFKNHLWEIQLDGATGNLLQIQKRNSDFIESIHDGSILDREFSTSKDQFKLIYTSIMGAALLMFTITGFWLWYGPKKLKRLKKNETKG